MAAYLWYDDEKGKHMPEDSAEAQGQPLAAQANIGGDGHSASVGDSYYSPGPRNGFIEIEDMTMELVDFKKRLEKVEGVKEVTLMRKGSHPTWGVNHQQQRLQVLSTLYSKYPENPVEFELIHWWRTYRCAYRPALGSPHRYVCTRVCALCCVFTPCV